MTTSSKSQKTIDAETLRYQSNTLVGANTMMAAEFKKACQEKGFTISVNEEYTVIKLFKTFEKGDTKAYSNIESEAYSLITQVPLKGGSVWGSLSDGVGGYVALQRGQFEICKSGKSGKRFLKELNAKTLD